MSIRRTTRSRKVMAVASMAAALALTVTGCGGDDGDPKSVESSTSAEPAEADGEPNPGTAAGDEADPNAKLAEIKGEVGLMLVVQEVKRDSGGFVTVSGEIKNTGDQPRSMNGMEGAESSVVAQNPNSVAGATLIDKAGKKRYYVLRDTDNRCLCTTAMTNVPAGGATPVFMQFPAPPSTTTEVDFTLPSFATASLKISG
ncbi:hypothetical protein AB0K86_16075 [Streptomyces clavifer]|uniref:hypothetical protein n=1 Tax=Streptomyces TaxID=1883 RepID=UPI0006F2093E|nr:MULTISPECIES: hypothetical protein [unclassified Streptomyces]KQX81342.1 hypothetical protein ASD26_06625 [Streptomyces sp. Root1319]KQZ06675.1 hypothetical protein ASD51_10390 [Streptomyces sp. Root55]